MIAVIAKLAVKEDKVEEAIALLKDLTAKVAEEKGTLAYSMNREKAKPNVIVMIERYRDKEALTLHGSSEHFKAFSAQIGGLLTAKPEITILEEIGSI